jgi:hypothetical protein
MILTSYGNRQSKVRHVMTEPVSVIIPTYNRAHLIERALLSVLASLSPDDEVIVVDDGSTDDTARVVSEVASRSAVPVTYHYQQNGRVGKARNTGVRLSRHPLVGFLDSDDQWLPDKMMLQRALMNARRDLVFCFSDIELRRDDGRVSHFGLRGWHHDDRRWDDILAPGVPYSSVATAPSARADFSVHIGDMYRVMLRANYVATQTALVRRSLTGNDFHFAEDVLLYEEWECFARLARLGPAAFLNYETCIQWGHAGPRVSRLDQFRSATAQLAVAERVWGNDARFLATDGPAYRRRLQDLRETRASCLAHEGRMKEARLEILGAVVPLRLRLLTALPGSLIRGIDGARTLAAHLGGLFSSAAMLVGKCLATADAVTQAVSQKAPQ